MPSRWLWLLVLLTSILFADPTSGEDRAGQRPADYLELFRLHVLRPAAPGRGALGPSETKARLAAGTVQGLTAAPAPGWPVRGFAPANTGHTLALGPVGRAQTSWTFAPGAFVWRPAVAPDGTIYVTTVSFSIDGVDGRLVALGQDGSVKWQTTLTSSTGVPLWASATPVLDSAGNIYLAWAHDRSFRSLAAISLDPGGAVRWRFEPALELEVTSHQEPVLVDGALDAAVDMLNHGRVAVGGANTGLHVLDAATGEPAARFAPGSFPMSQASDRAGNSFFYSFDETGRVSGTAEAAGSGGRSTRAPACRSARWRSRPTARCSSATARP